MIKLNNHSLNSLCWTATVQYLTTQNYEFKTVLIGWKNHWRWAHWTHWRLKRSLPLGESQNTFGWKLSVYLSVYFLFGGREEKDWRKRLWKKKDFHGGSKIKVPIVFIHSSILLKPTNTHTGKQWELYSGWLKH